MIFESFAKRKILAERFNVTQAMKALKELKILDDSYDVTNILDESTKVKANNVDQRILRELERMNPPSEICIENAELERRIDALIAKFEKLEPYLLERSKLFMASSHELAIKSPQSSNNFESILGEEEISLEDSLSYSLLSSPPTPGNLNDNINRQIENFDVKDIIWGRKLYHPNEAQKDYLNKKAQSEFIASRKTQNLNNNPQMNNARKNLPIYAKRSEILETLERDKVLIVTGDTGSGKSTQIPQYIRERMMEIGKISDCSIIVTQPRRMSCIALADRVAHEMGETSMGGVNSRKKSTRNLEGLQSDQDQIERDYGFQNIGFQVRLYQSLPRYNGFLTDNNGAIGPILFCTAGILLRKLQNNPNLMGVSHVIVDEIHEHDVLTDFLLAVLKRVRRNNPSISIVLMSATMDAIKFSKYLDSCPIINVQGRMFPVISYFLPEIQELITDKKGAMNQNIMKPSKPLPFNDLTTTTLKFESEQIDSLLVDINPISKSELIGEFSEAETFRNKMQTPKLDIKLTVDTINYIHKSQPLEGAILVFLPGWQEIRKVKEELEKLDGNLTRNEPRMVILPVHSSLPQEEQSRVFLQINNENRNNSSKLRKVILSTNITETSLTINDVAYVVDTGLAKEHKYNTDTGISYLDLVWASKSNIKQRAGRAGRTSAGKCFHLYPLETFERFSSYPQPEILRIPLETIVLETKLLCSNYHYKNSEKPAESVEDFLSSLIIPPTSVGIHMAIDVLTRELGFLDQNENLTNLGRRLIGINCHPRLSLALAKAAFLGYTDQVISMAAAMSHNRSLLISSNSSSNNRIDTGNFGNKDLITLKKIKEKYALTNGSDHLAHLNIYLKWREALETGSAYRILFEEENGIDSKNVKFIHSIRNQLISEAKKAGIIDEKIYRDLRRGEVHHRHVQGYRQQTTLRPDDYKMLKGILASSFYPNVAKVVYGDVRRGKLVKDSIRLMAKKYIPSNTNNENDDQVPSNIGSDIFDDQENIVVPSGESLCSDKKNYDTDWITYLNILKLPNRQNVSLCRDVSTFHPAALVLMNAGSSCDIQRTKDHSVRRENSLKENMSPSIILESDPLLTFSVRDNVTAERILTLRRVFSSLFSAYVSHGHETFFRVFPDSSNIPDLEENSLNVSSEISEIYQGMKDIFKRIMNA
ncbi:ATP-dependent DNA/RNA helicase DHX36-like isoform X2 [Gordionus sp. m RMFG-2023]